MRLPISLKLSMSYFAVVCVGRVAAVLSSIEPSPRQSATSGAGPRPRRPHALLIEVVSHGGMCGRTRLAAAPDERMRSRRDGRRLDSLADRLAPAAGGRVAMIGPDGRVLGDSDLAPAAIPADDPRHAGRSGGRPRAR